MAMNFRRRRSADDPEINLIPFIDVLLVVLIFLMLTTTYAKWNALHISLPSADNQARADKPSTMDVAIAADGRTMVNGELLADRSVEGLAAAMGRNLHDSDHTLVVIAADASATHQSVINVMDAARRVGLLHITFATMAQGGSTAPTGPTP